MRSKTTFLVLLMAAQMAHALDSVPKAEYRQREQTAAQFTAAQPCSLPLTSRPWSTRTTGRTRIFFYLTGSNEPGGAVLLIGDGPAATTRLGTVVPAHSYREIVFLPTRNPVREKYTGAKTDAATPGAEKCWGSTR